MIGECGCCSDSRSAAAAINADHAQKFSQSIDLQLLLFYYPIYVNERCLPS